jgi:hypothetical protein
MSALLPYRLRWRLRWLWEHYTPRAMLRNWAYEGWGEDGFTATRRTRFADWVLWKLAIAEVILRCVVSWGRHDRADFAWWRLAALRAKAIVCLVLGWHWRESEGRFCFLDGVEVLGWNERRTSWEYEEYDWDRLEVGHWGGPWLVSVEIHEP